MTENLAARGEGLAGLVAKWRAEVEKCCPILLSDPKSNVTDASCRQQMRDADELETALTRERMHQRALREKACNLRALAALEAAAPASTAPKPKFPELKHQGSPIVGMDYDHKLTVITTELFEQLVKYGAALATPSPQAPQEQCKVFSTTSAREQSSATASDNLSAAELAIKHCREQINALDKLEGATEYEKGDFAGQIDAYAQVGEILHDLIHVKSVPAATQPAGSGASEPPFRKVVEWLHQRMATAQNLPYEEGDVCLECADAVRDELQPLMEAALKLAGSPRKVGEDADSHLSGRIAARLDEYKFIAHMIAGVEEEDWYKRRIANLESMYAASSVPVGEQK